MNKIKKVGIRLSIVLALLFAFGGNVFSDNSVSNLLNIKSDLSTLLPVGETIQMEGFLPTGDSGPCAQKITKEPGENEIKYEFYSEDEARSVKLTSNLDHSLRFGDGIYQFNSPKADQFLGYNQRITKYNRLANTETIDYLKGGKIKDIKVIACDKNTLDSDFIGIFLRGVLLSGTNPSHFTADVIVKTLGLKLKMDFQMVTTNNFEQIAPEYHFPAQFQVIAKQKQIVDVFVYQLAGMAYYLYPHKFYAAFMPNWPYNYIANWGGSPAEYYFCE